MTTEVETGFVGDTCAASSYAGVVTPKVARPSRFGVSIDWRTNAQMLDLFEDLGAFAVFDKFARPVLKAGDVFVVRFPFTAPHRLPQWTDIQECNRGLYDAVAKICQACRSQGVEPVLYLRRPEENELAYAAKMGVGLTFPFTAAAREWQGVTIALDEGIGQVRRSGTGGRADAFRAAMKPLHRLALEPGWDRNWPEDWLYPIVCASDLYRQVVNENWVSWRPWPAAASGGPEITLWFHENLTRVEEEGSRPETRDEERLRILTELRTHAVLCRQNRWSGLFPGDLFVNYGIGRGEVWGASFEGMGALGA